MTFNNNTYAFLFIGSQKRFLSLPCSGKTATSTQFLLKYELIIHRFESMWDLLPRSFMCLSNFCPGWGKGAPKPNFKCHIPTSKVPKRHLKKHHIDNLNIGNHISLICLFVLLKATQHGCTVTSCSHQCPSTINLILHQQRMILSGFLFPCRRFFEFSTSEGNSCS